MTSRWCVAWCFVGVFLGAFVTAAPAHADTGIVRVQVEPGLTLEKSATSDRVLRAFVDAEPGSDITERLQAALDRVRGYGGEVVLPPGGYQLSKTVSLGGSLAKFPKGSVQHVTVSGSGTMLEWVGKDEGAIIDMPSPYNCCVRKLRITGKRGTHWKKVVGVRYRGGIERERNGGKNNRVEDLLITNVGVGLEVGNLFGPDLVGGTFTNIHVNGVRIGFRLMGANVTGMVFINPQVASFEEAGFKIVGFGARQIRKSADEPKQANSRPGVPNVLMDADNEREIFQSDLPAWLTREGVTYPTFWRETAEGRKALFAGGGALDVTIYGLLAHSSHVDSWAIDTNWGNVRVYSARIEGMGGVFRSTEKMPAGRFSNVLVDVSATSVGGLHGNAIELHDEGPLHLIGGVFQANIALADNSQLHQMGTRFQPWKRSTLEALLPLDFQDELDDRITRTGRQRTVVHLRGKAEVVQIIPLQDLGFRRLSNGGLWAAPPVRWSTTMAVPAGEKAVVVAFPEGKQQRDDNYQVALTAQFNAGPVWISQKQPDGFRVHLTHAAPPQGKLDVTVTRTP